MIKWTTFNPSSSPKPGEYLIITPMRSITIAVFDGRLWINTYDDHPVIVTHYAEVNYP